MNIKIYKEDYLIGVKKLVDESVDLVVTSPPYNVDLGKNKYNKNPYDLYNDNKEHKEYILWLKKIFEETYRVLKDGGRVCINIGDGKNGSIPKHSDIIQFMIELKYIPMTTIIWNKNQNGNRCAWGSFQSPSSPSFPTPFEYILVFAKGSKKLLKENDIQETDLTKQEFIDWSWALWSFAPETRMKKIGHPASFPEELPKRCIKMLSWANKNVTVLDMFSGAATTAKVCRDLNRNFIGFEISENYMKISADRLGVKNYVIGEDINIDF